MSYIQSTLSKDEKVELIISYHWWIWFFPIVSLFFIVVSSGISILLTIYLSLRIIYTEQGVTSKKGIKKVGIISRNTEELLLSKVETVEIKQGVLGRILGFGTVQITGTGTSFVLFDLISNPIEVKKQIEKLIEN